LSKYFSIQFFHIIYNQEKLAIIAISLFLSLPFIATLTSKLLIISREREKEKGMNRKTEDKNQKLRKATKQLRKKNPKTD
jgi:hypothetical protein